MEVIEVSGGFSLEKEDAGSKGSGSAADAVRRGAEEKTRLNAMATKESNAMFVSTGRNMPPPPRQAVRGAEIADEDRAEHQKLVIALSRYGQSKRFAEYLKSMQFNLNVGHLRKQSLASLKDTLARVRITAQNRSINNLLEDSIFGALQFGEIACVNSAMLNKKVRLAGLTQALRADETFLDCVEAISLDYGMLTHAGPELRMIYAVISAMSKVHGINTFVEKRKQLLARMESADEAGDSSSNSEGDIIADDSAAATKS